MTQKTTDSPPLPPYEILDPIPRASSKSGSVGDLLPREGFETARRRAPHSRSPKRMNKSVCRRRPSCV